MYNILIGTPISNFIDLKEGELRIISGDALNGKEIKPQNSLNYYDEIISVIKTDNKREFLGWMMPGLNKYSLTNTFLSKLNNYNTFKKRMEISKEKLRKYIMKNRLTEEIIIHTRFFFEP